MGAPLAGVAWPCVALVEAAAARMRGILILLAVLLAIGIACIFASR